MEKRLASLLLAFLAGCPLASFADQDLQARFEKSLNDARSITNVEIQMLDTLWLNEAIGSKDSKLFIPAGLSRTVQYSYIASGKKYRGECKLISSSQTNGMHLEEAAFDGSSFVSYDADQRYMTRKTGDTTGDNVEDPTSPLIAPFMFLTRRTDGCINCVLRFTDVLSPAFGSGLTLPAAKSSDGLLEIDLPGLPLMKQPTHWKIFLDPKGDSFTPKTIKMVGAGAETVYELLDYTNLGAYQFPSVIAWSSTKYPATSPATVQSTGMVTMVSVRAPEQMPDSAFQVDEASALTVWDWDQKNFAKISPEAAARKAYVKSLPKIYDESADGSKEIAEALATARKEHKHILLQFGANWCESCHELHKLFETDKSIAEILESDYVVVMIDVNKDHNKDTDAKYGYPTRRYGLPAIAVLDADGKQLDAHNPGQLKEVALDRPDNLLSSPDKLLAFLKEWAPK
jgi:thiol-disulfide isomerase/thioredoxin